jgi:hypothetical protein
MRLRELYGRYEGRDLYVVGTGPSMRVFPVEMLAGRLTMGLNQAWKHFERGFAPTWMLTAHPELWMGEDGYLSAAAKPRTTWIVKKKPPADHLELDDPRCYVFGTEEDFGVVRKRPEDVLFLGRGIQQTAIDLAARMGFKNVFLVGCDMTDLGGEHHGHAQHVRWLGWQPKDVYSEYREWTAQMRQTVRDAYGVNVLTLSPFLGAGHAEEDYDRLKRELKLANLPKPKDVSPYKRPRGPVKPTPPPRKRP